MRVLTPALRVVIAHTPRQPHARFDTIYRAVLDAPPASLTS